MTCNKIICPVKSLRIIYTPLPPPLFLTSTLHARVWQELLSENGFILLETHPDMETSRFNYSIFSLRCNQISILISVPVCIVSEVTWTPCGMVPTSISSPHHSSHAAGVCERCGSKITLTLITRSLLSDICRRETWYCLCYGPKWNNYLPVFLSILFFHNIQDIEVMQQHWIISAG